MNNGNPIKVVLAGNPNSGKTTLFNRLTGARQHVGNYAGVTVERRQGRYHHQHRHYQVEDLPGTYSVSSYSPEERIARDALLSAEADVVVLVVDSTTLKRSLVLLAQAMLLDANPVLCLNMADEAHSSGQRLDLPALQKLLGFPVVETVGSLGSGLDQLRQAIDEAAEHPVKGSAKLVLGQRLEQALDPIIRELVPDAGPADPGRRWVAARLLAGDPQVQQQVHQQGASAALEQADRQRRELEADTGMDTALYLSHRYYGFVDGLLRETILTPARADARALSDRIDSVVVNRVLGVPLFLAVMYGVFWFTFRLGEIPMGWIESAFAALGQWVGALWPHGSDSPLRSLLVDGIIGGVGGVLVFLPNILLLFLGLALLEDTGYMARAAFIMDRLMHTFGLHGRSFIPMVTGFGCSIPGIMATRTIESERDRLTTMLVLPLISCGARLPIWMLLIPAFFAPPWRAPVLWGIYMVGIGLALLLALLLRRTLLRGEEAPFVMELPPYRLPTPRAVLQKIFERCWLYTRKAGTVILGISVVMWFITSYPRAGSYEVDALVDAGQIKVERTIPGAKTTCGVEVATTCTAGAAGGTRTPAARVERISTKQLQQRRASEDLRASVAGRVGRALEPALRPLGFDWKTTIALIGAFAAKEVFVAQMGIVHALGDSDAGSVPLRQALRRDYSPLTGFSLMLFLLIATPCMATLAVTRRESGSWKWALLQFGGLTLLAYVVCLVFYQVGRLVLS